jgi:putative intracellular protease/amidase/YHS domain-containing protein
MFFLCRAVILLIALAVSLAAQESATVALQGLDAVALTQGRETKGRAEFAVERGRFRYLFANARNLARFQAAPERYEVQNKGECAFMPGVPGDPELWQVYQGKIYLFGTPLCRERFNLAPELILHPEKRPKIKPRNVAIVLYTGVELLDFAGPGEVFAAAQTVDGQTAFNVYTVAATDEPLMSQGFVTIKPQYTFANAPKPDIVVFPGGNVNNFTNHADSMTYAKAVAGEAEVAMSVCNGAFVLANAKLLENKRATTHWSAVRGLRRQVPAATVLENARFVDNGQIVTTAGVSAGIDGALHVVARLLGRPAAQLTAKYMEYNWSPDAPRKEAK